MSEQQTIRFDAPPDDPIAAYLASGLTSLNEDQLTIVELVSGLVAGFCSDAGVIVHQPVLHTHPADHGDTPPAKVHDVETLCDWIAASILMPRSWIQRFADQRHYNLSLIRLVANRADVSLSAAAVRLAEVGARTCMLLRFQRTPRRWVVVGQAAVPAQYHGALGITPETSSLIDSLVSRRDTWQDLTLTVPEQLLHAHAHVDRSGKTCIALITSLESLP